MVTLLGSNGAGKSTTLRAISGLAKPASRRHPVRRPVDRGPRAGSDRPPRHLACAGRPPGVPGPDGEREHHARRLEPPGVGSSEISREADAMFDLFPDIRDVLQCAGLDAVGRPVADGGGRARPDGEAAAAAAGRALAGPGARDRAGGVHDHFARSGRDTTVLLVEQNARMGLSVADHGFVLETGRIVLGGKPDELWGNEAIRRRLSRWPRQSAQRLINAAVSSERVIHGHHPGPRTSSISSSEVFSAIRESSPEEAKRIATYLTTANLTGHDSHGVIRVPVYVRWKKMGYDRLRTRPPRSWSIRRRSRWSTASSAMARP